VLVAFEISDPKANAVRGSNERIAAQRRMLFAQAQVSRSYSFLLATQVAIQDLNTGRELHTQSEQNDGSLHG